MKITKLDLSRLRNNAHFQLVSEVYDLIKASEPVLKLVRPQYDVFVACCAREDTVLKRIRKSGFTDEIDAANQARNTVFRGMIDAGQAALNHFTPDVAAAARRVKIVTDTYGNVVKLPLDEETSAITNLLTELQTNHAAELIKTGLTDWAAELGRRNKAFEELVQQRYEETAGRTDLVMKEVRADVDEAYRVLTLCIEALWVMASTEEERAPVTQCIRLLNAIIEHYSLLKPHSKGHNDDGNGKLKMDN